jgi:hypothetical protein
MEQLCMYQRISRKFSERKRHVVFTVSHQTRITVTIVGRPAQGIGKHDRRQRTPLRRWKKRPDESVCSLLAAPIWEKTPTTSAMSFLLGSFTNYNVNSDFSFSRYIAYLQTEGGSWTTDEYLRILPLVAFPTTERCALACILFLWQQGSPSFFWLLVRLSRNCFLT